MEKTTLKNVLNNLTVGQTISFLFSSKSPHAEMTGSYTYLTTRRGRGKGGTCIVDLKALETDDTYLVSTSQSDDIVNVTVNGETFGLESEDDLPIKYPAPDAERSVSYKRLFNSLSNASVDNPRTLHVVAPDTIFDGTHNIVAINKLRGRAAQLEAVSDMGTKIWSNKHSSVIESMTADTESSNEEDVSEEITADVTSEASDLISE